MIETSRTVETTTIRRRSVVAATAWTIPVIAMAVAAPAASASETTCLPEEMYTLTAVMGRPTGPTDAEAVGENTWKLQAKHSLNYSITYGNIGPAPMPVGGTFQVYMPVYSTSSDKGAAPGAMWETITVTTADALTFSGPVVSDGGIDANGFQWNIYTFTLNERLVAGQTFTVDCVMTAGTKTAKPDRGTADFDIDLVTRISHGTVFCDGSTSSPDTFEVVGPSFILRFQ